eukprot:2605220-Pleurochrysis_carterae.AAC.1
MVGGERVRVRPGRESPAAQGTLHLRKGRLSPRGRRRRRRRQPRGPESDRRADRARRGRYLHRRP